jgi:hypothetical protein
MFLTVYCSVITNKNQQNVQMTYIFSMCRTYMFRSFFWPSSGCAVRAPTRPPHSARTRTQDILNTYTELFNFNFNYQYTTQCLDCGEYIYKQLRLGRMHI